MQKDVELGIYGRYLCGRHDVTELKGEDIPFYYPGTLCRCHFRCFASPALRLPFDTFEAPAPQFVEETLCGSCDGISVMLRYDILGTHVW